MTDQGRLVDAPLSGFVNVEIGDEVYTCTSETCDGWLVANRTGAPSAGLSLFLFEDREFRYGSEINAPREPSISRTGRVIVIFTCEPDEVEAGGIKVLDPDGSPVLTQKFESYPLRVAITPEGRFVALSIPPTTIIFDLSSGTERARHKYRGGKKSGLSSGIQDGQPCFYLHDLPSEEPAYAIGPDGETVWEAG